MTWRRYKRLGVSEMRPYELGESLEGVSVSNVDVPSTGGMIAHTDAF